MSEARVPFHPYAELFPAITSPEFDALGPELAHIGQAEVGRAVRQRLDALGLEVLVLGVEDREVQGQTMFEDFVKCCRTEEGYAALKNVVTKEKSDSMQSFLFAETFKYFYLLFATPKTIEFDRVIFNTEAHPIKRSQ